MQDERKRGVAAGYDRIADRYSQWLARIEGDPRDRMLAEFTQRLPAGGRVLDLGCGPGVPSTRVLAERFEVVGIDISEAQIESARALVPKATFIHGDFAEMDLPDASLTGVVALYSVSHIPREDHARLFARIARWLVPGGLFLATLGAADSPDWVGPWLGEPMFFSSFDAETNRALLRAAGFTLLVDEIVEMREPEGLVSLLWVIGQRPVGTSAAIGAVCSGR
jgi:ubiquinone/menaquinone biosynthesis C-methylase UbiE